MDHRSVYAGDIYDRRFNIHVYFNADGLCYKGSETEMRIPFIDKIKELEAKVEELDSEITWLIDNKHKLEKKFALIERILKQGESGEIAKNRMIKTIKHIINT
tara:strand:- start:126 stop:434 length:309 start_codon:yes stop_codon:yes gene_type:complete